MSSFYLYRKQKGEGCDYTIACGQKLSKLKATTKEAAIEEVMGLGPSWKEEVLAAVGKDADIRDIEGYLSDYVCDTCLRDVRSGEGEMEQVSLLEVGEKSDMIPLLKSKLAEVDEWKFEMRTKIQEEDERKAYEKMKAKFEKPKKETVNA